MTTYFVWLGLALPKEWAVFVAVIAGAIAGAIPGRPVDKVKKRDRD